MVSDDGDDVNHPVIMHCNYAEQGQTIEEMVALAVRLGFDGVEFRRRRGKRQETPAEYLAEIARAVEKHRLGQVIFGGPGPNLMVGDEADHRRELDAVVDFYTLAREHFELTVCNTFAGPLQTPDVDPLEFDRHGSAVATDAQWDAAVRGFQELGDLAKSLGFKFALETHNFYLHDLPAPARKLVDLIDRETVGVNLDFGNIVLHPAGIGLEESVQTLASSVLMLHLKNAYLIPQRKHHNWIGCGLEDGVINNRQLLRLAKAQGFAGPIVIEAPWPGDRERFAARDVAYLRSLLAEV